MTNTNAGIVSSQLSTSTTMSEPGKMGGRVRVATDNIAVTTADFDADGDTVVLAALPSNARIHSIIFGNDSLAATMTANIGLYDWTKEAGLGAVIDEDYFASALDVAAANGHIQVVGESDNAVSINEFGDRLWEIDNETTDPGGHYAVVLTAASAATTGASGDVSYAIYYTVA